MQRSDGAVCVPQGMQGEGPHALITVPSNKVNPVTELVKSLTTMATLGVTGTTVQDLVSAPTPEVCSSNGHVALVSI